MGILAEKYNSKSREIKVIYMSSYIPRECGIATFTKDLTSAINLLNPDFLAEIMALDEPGSKDRQYPWEVKYRVKDDDEKSFAKASDYINQSGCDILCIEHEFGIFGPDEGINIVKFIKLVKKPIVVTFHTVLSNPSDKKRFIVNQIGQRVDAIVVMIKEAKKRLVELYGISPNKIVVIPHGVPDIPYGPTEGFKALLKIDPKRPVISSFGLINRGKGIEYMIEAMAEIVKTSPKALYIIIGGTHPVVKRQEGEIYRDQLKKIIKSKNLEKNIIFINKYLPLDELIQYLRATDIYVTPYLEPQQITSGTLAYAVGAGKACVSTKYLYAKEVLSQGRGVVVDFQSAKELADAIKELVINHKKQQEISMKSYLYGRKMIWPNVALGYLDLFNLIKQQQ